MTNDQISLRYRNVDIIWILVFFSNGGGVVCYGSCITPRGENKLNLRFEISDLRLEKIWNLQFEI